jgi:PAS domain S-box-containing protein
MNSTACIQSPQAGASPPVYNDSMFRQVVEQSPDAIFLSDPVRQVFVDCNQASLDMMHASSKGQLLMKSPAELSPEFQPDGRSSYEHVKEETARVLKEGSLRFEWWGRRIDGEEFPIEVLLMPIQNGEQTLVAAFCRDITERKQAERQLLELNQTLERRVTERTAELSASEARFRALVEHAPEAIVVYSVDTGRFLFGNQHACDLYGVPMSKLAELSPADVSPEVQPGGQHTRDLVGEKVTEVLEGGVSIFEWTHKRPDGGLVPTEVRLLRLPAGGQTLIRSSIIDNTERKRAERALRESETKFRALFEGTSNGVVLMTPNKLLEVNPAAVRILGRRSAAEMVGRYPSAFSPTLQPNGVSSEVMAQRYIEECIAKGSLRVEWLCSSPEGLEIPLEVLLTRIEWSGQEVIQACITDITERKHAERALRESEEKFRALFEGSSQGVVLHDENQILEVNPAAVRIMECESPQELIGRHPTDASPRLQPNGELSASLGRKHIQECLLNGSARFDWVCQTPQGRQIPIEVTLTRIQWSGRQVIQALISDISERKKAEAKLRASEARLRESEARFRAAFRASALCMTISRMDDGKFLLANEAFLNWTGYRHDEVAGRVSQELGIWADNADRDRFWQELRLTHSVRERECLMRNRHGKLFTMLVSCDAIEIEGATHLLTVGLDITERKIAEAALAESEARFSAAFNSSPIMTGITRASDGKFVLANDAAMNWIGCDRDQILGHTSLELGLWVDPDERARFWKHLQISGFTQPWECQLQNRHGKRATMLASGVKIEISGEDHLLVMMLDISERKKAEAELQASEARLRESEGRFSAAFQASPVFITILGMSDGKYVLANDAFLNWMGLSRSELTGRTSADFGMWEKPEAREEALHAMRTAGSIRNRECRWRNQRGETLTLLLSCESIFLENAPHILSFAQDITQRKRAEEELRKTLEREKELSQLKSNFVSMVSHEFRTPLGIIQSSAELLRDFHERMPGEERKEQLESISRNTRRMAGMMEEILVLSRLDAGKVEFQPATLDLNVFSRRIVDEVLSATNRRCDIELVLKSPTTAKADERLLGHIFANLLTNAVKYSEAGSTVNFLVNRDGSDAVCVIRDQGIGIPKEDQPHLFLAFHRGSNVGTRPGTGLGLLLVKRCADLHGGKVEVESHPGAGTTVTVRFPAFWSIA